MFSVSLPLAMRGAHAATSPSGGALKEHEAGASVPDLARRHGVAENTIYRWQAKFGGMDVSDAKKPHLRSAARITALSPEIRASSL